MGNLKQLLARNSPLIILAGLCILFAVSSESFRSPGNVQSVLYRTSAVGIMAAGQTLVILTGGIDLSVGSIASVSGVVAALVMRQEGMPMVFGVFAGCLLGLFLGAFNGVLVAKGRIPPFIVTLGTMMIAQGASLLLSGSRSISGLPESFAYLGGTRGWWIPVLITVSITVVCGILLAFTRFGRATYAVGGNMSAARLSGIPVDRVRIAVFSLCGLLAGFAGIMLASRTSIASPNAGQGMELDAIAACVIGGASLMGGEGGAVGTLAGALIMNVLVNICNLQKLDTQWQMVLVGGLIIVLVYYDNFRKRKAGLLKEL